MSLMVIGRYLFAEIIGELRRVGERDKHPDYHLRLGSVGIRVPILRQRPETQPDSRMPEQELSS